MKPKYRGTGVSKKKFGITHILLFKKPRIPNIFFDILKPFIFNSKFILNQTECHLWSIWYISLSYWCQFQIWLKNAYLSLYKERSQPHHISCIWFFFGGGGISTTKNTITICQDMQIVTYPCGGRDFFNLQRRILAQTIFF